MRFTRRTPCALVLLLATTLPLAPAAAQEAISPVELELVRQVERARIAAVKKVFHTVVAIYGLSRQGGGSGVVYDPEGYALTNYHVVAGAGVEGYGGLADGKLYKWKLIGLDPGGDVAIIKLEKPTPDHRFAFAEIGDSDTVRVGDFVMAMGNPFILAEDQTPTVTLGVVSGVKRYQPGTGPTGTMLEYGNCIQIDSSINPGNSGGPLFNMQGRIIGINGRGSFEERGRVNVGVGYAISANQIRTFIPDMLATKTARHGTLEANFERRGDRECVCVEINLDSAIAAAGMELSDELVRFDGHAITTANQYKNLVCTLPAEWPVEVVWRKPDGQIKSAWVRLASLAYPKPQERPQRNDPRPDQPQPKPKEDGDKDGGDSKKDEAPKDDAEDGQGAKDGKQESDKQSDAENPAAPPDGKAEWEDLDDLREQLRKLEEQREKIESDPEADAAAKASIARQIEQLKKVIEELEKAAPKDGPQPRPNPIQLPRRPALKLEFGKVRDEKLNRLEAERVVRQYRQFLGGEEALAAFAAFRDKGKSTDPDGGVTMYDALSTPDGRFNETVRLANGDTIRAIWDGQTYRVIINGEDQGALEGDEAMKDPAVGGTVLTLRTLYDKDGWSYAAKLVHEGSDKALGRNAHRIRAEDKYGNAVLFWFSVDDPSFRADGHDGSLITRLLKTQVVGVEHAVAVLAFKQADAIRDPVRKQLVKGMAEQVIGEFEDTSVEVLKELPDNAFKTPEGS